MYIQNLKKIFIINLPIITFWFVAIFFEHIQDSANYFSTNELISTKPIIGILQGNIQDKISTKMKKKHRTV